MLSLPKTFQKNLNYISTPSIQEVMTFHNVGEQRFESDFAIPVTISVNCSKLSAQLSTDLIKKSFVCCGLTCAFDDYGVPKAKN